MVNTYIYIYMYMRVCCIFFFSPSCGLTPSRWVQAWIWELEALAQDCSCSQDCALLHDGSIRCCSWYLELSTQLGGNFLQCPDYYCLHRFLQHPHFSSSSFSPWYFFSFSCSFQSGLECRCLERCFHHYYISLDMKVPHDLGIVVPNNIWLTVILILGPLINICYRFLSTLTIPATSLCWSTYG